VNRRKMKDTGTVSVASALGRTTHEIRRAAAVLVEIEHAIGNAITGSSEWDREHLREIQMLDHVQQTLDGLSGFLDALRVGLSEEWVVDAKGAARSVNMSDLSARLRGDDSAKGDEPKSSEDVYELFD